MRRSPASQYWRSRASATAGRARSRRAARGLTTALSIGAVIGVALPASTAGAAPGGPPPTLKQLLAKAAVLTHQVDELSQQYDALRIQYNEARAQVKLAKLTVRQDRRLVTIYQSSIAKIAAAGYITGGVSPAIELLQSSNPQAMLNRASILSELQKQNSDQLNLVASARAAAQRASLLAVQEEHRAAKLSAAMQGKVAKIQARENVLNSKAFAQAVAIYNKTGKYPNIHVTGDSVGVQALRYALTKVGDPYVFAAAGPNAFDCSGLVVWAYAQIGISLPHYTGYLWNSGQHISRADLQPGDLVFFYPDIGHVGIYVGNGLMVDAPHTGTVVQVEPIWWPLYVGAVRIA